MSSRVKTIGLFLLSILILSLIAFHSKSPLVFFRFDGSQLLITAAMQRDWSIGGWLFTSNPLQGIGGAEHFQHNIIDPGSWLVAHLPPSIAPTLAMTFYALELAIAIGWLATRMGLRPLSTATAVWLGLLLAFPYIYPPLGFEFLWGVPLYASLIFQDTAIIILFLDLGKGTWRKDLARLTGIVFLAVYQLNLVTMFTPVSAVALIFFGIVALLAAESKRERVLKVLYVTPPLLVLLFLFGPLLLGMYGFSKATFFWYEFYPRPGSWRDTTFFIASHSHWPAWLALALALTGGLHAALHGGATMRSMARGFLAFFLFEFVIAIVTSAGWKGPRLLYVDTFAYPFYCVFAAYALANLTGWVNDHSEWLRQRRHTLLIVLCLLPWLVLIDAWRPPLERPKVRGHNPYIWPPAETPVTKFLAGEIGLKPGATFRGRLANVAGSDFEPEWKLVPLITQHNYDVMNLYFSGNDHRLYGLWYFGIPTLIELNQFSSPFFHLVNARLLNAPGTIDTRSYETQSLVNERIMAMLGASYLMSDKLLPEQTPIAQETLTNGRDLYVYPIADSNIAGYSVTQTRHAANGQEAINLLADSSVDLRSTAILTSQEALPPLTKATSSKLVVNRGAYQIEATSQGFSLLVLPVEYSHCLEAHLTTSSMTPPRLLRANLTLAAVLFSSDVKGELRLRYGPRFEECRREDWREAKALMIGDVRHWPTP
jgi:hypothetical protein